MATPASCWQLTTRDRDILAALDLCPLEAKDLLALSETFAQPFSSLDRVRKTLQRLQAARQMQGWRYATITESGGAAPNYFKLTRDGYRTLHEDDAARPPTKRYLSETRVGRHHHQRCLTHYIVKTHVAAHRLGLHIADSFPENTYRIDTPLGALFPDRRFTIVTPAGESFVNCLELDNSTETLTSRWDVDSIELKLKKYLHDLAACEFDYRVQFVVTRSRQRLQHLRELATRLQPAIKYAPFYLVHLDDYLRAAQPFLAPIFVSSRSAQIGLFRSQTELLSRGLPAEPQMSLLAPATA